MYLPHKTWFGGEKTAEIEFVCGHLVLGPNISLRVVVNAEGMAAFFNTLLE
jgi:hypothetical protein